jgi:hypothetical protein
MDERRGVVCQGAAGGVPAAARALGALGGAAAGGTQGQRRGAAAGASAAPARRAATQAAPQVPRARAHARHIRVRTAAPQVRARAYSILKLNHF